MLYTLNLYNVTCQIYFNKKLKKKRLSQEGTKTRLNSKYNKNHWGFTTKEQVQGGDQWSTKRRPQG